MTAASDASPTERTDLAWQRTGLGLLSVGGLLGARALGNHLPALLVAAVVAAVLALQRGVVRVRTAVIGHPDGRAGRLAEHEAARWRLAGDRFAALQREYAAFEADPGAVAARGPGVARSRACRTSSGPCGGSRR